MIYSLNTTHNMQKTGKMVSDMKNVLYRENFTHCVSQQLLVRNYYITTAIHSTAVLYSLQYRTSTAFKLLHWQYVHLNTIIDNIPIIQLTTVCRWHLFGVSKGAPLLGRQLEMLLTWGACVRQDGVVASCWGETGATGLCIFLNVLSTESS